MDLNTHYKTLVGRAGKALEHLASTSEQFTNFGAVHNFGADFEALLSSVDGRPEAMVFSLAIKEFYYSLYAIAGGSYRHGHISLRLFFELFSAGIYFSAYEIKLRRWLSGETDSDVNWAIISNFENGIYSSNFLRAFHPGLAPAGNQYAAMAATAYRECSEFVHGNIQTHELGGTPLAFDGDLLSDWIDRASAVRLCVIFAFAGRYLPFLDNQARQKVESVMLESFGHLTAVQTIYS